MCKMLANFYVYNINCKTKPPLKATKCNVVSKPAVELIFVFNCIIVQMCKNTVYLL